MAKSDVLVRFKADTQNYDANVARARKQLDGFAKDNYTAGGAMKQMTSQVVASAAKFATFGAAISGALKVAKDAFFANEQQLDEWNATVKSAESVYKGFLNSINTGDISGFLSRIGQIAQAARDAYNAIDELETFNAFNQRNVARTHREMTEAVVDYREGTGSKESARAAADAYKKQLEERQRQEKNAYDATIKKIAQENGVSAADLQKVMSGSYGDYKALKETPLTGKRLSISGSSAFGGGMTTNTEYYAANERERLGQTLRMINDEGELDYLQRLGAQAEKTGDEIAQVDRQMARLLGTSKATGTSGGGGKGGGGKETLFSSTLEMPKDMGKIMPVENVTKSMAELERALSMYKDKLANATNILDANAAEAGIESVQKQISVQPLALRMGIDTESAIQLQDQVNSFIENLKSTIQPIPITLSGKGGKGLPKIGEETMDAWQKAAAAVNNVGSALQGLDDPSAKIAGIVGQAIANIALGFAQAAASPATGAAGVFGWIAAATAGLATMVATIASIKQATAGSYAEGGIVPGNNYNDGLTASVSSGELILNQAQQNTLASRLQESSSSAGGRATVSGEQIILAVNAYGRRTGRGELIRL